MNGLWEQDVSFTDTRECKLLTSLLEAADQQDLEMFTEVPRRINRFCAKSIAFARQLASAIRLRRCFAVFGANLSHVLAMQAVAEFDEISKLVSHVCVKQRTARLESCLPSTVHDLLVTVYFCDMCCDCVKHVVWWDLTATSHTNSHTPDAK
eukprot:1934961-Rhodomonas_salina.3